MSVSGVGRHSSRSRVQLYKCVGSSCSSKCGVLIDQVWLPFETVDNRLGNPGLKQPRQVAGWETPYTSTHSVNAASWATSPYALSVDTLLLGPPTSRTGTLALTHVSPPRLPSSARSWTCCSVQCVQELTPDGHAYTSCPECGHKHLAHTHCSHARSVVGGEVEPNYCEQNGCRGILKSDPVSVKERKQAS